jgi:hypothetical protein
MSRCDVATTIRELVVGADAQAGWTTLVANLVAEGWPAASPAPSPAP